MQRKSDNPFVGPRPISYGERLFGREHEARELTELLIAERIVLLHSPSAAGKTSLIQAALLPALETRHFKHLPVIRVGLEAGDGVGNRYVNSTLISLNCQSCELASNGGLVDYVNRTLEELNRREQEALEGEQTPLEELSGAALLKRISIINKLESKSDNVVLIFDQFEEIITLNQADREVKIDFFRQIGEVLRDRRLWALFSMREDYVGALEPFLDYIPTQFHTRYRVDFLSVQVARSVLRETAATRGVEFTERAAASLVSDLSMLKVQQRDGRLKEQPGPHVEPVLLQVVCHRLWSKMQARWDVLGALNQRRISQEDIVREESVTDALKGYYAYQVQRIAREISNAGSGVNERAIREWFEEHLITKQGLRDQVQMNVQETEGLDNAVVEALLDTFLVRVEKRLNSNWYELAHDRLIEPIREDNARWFNDNLNWFERRARTWRKNGEGQMDLLSVAEVLEAEQLVQSRHLQPYEQEFLDQSREGRDALIKRQKELINQKKQALYLLIGAVIFTALVVTVAISAFASLQAVKKKTLSKADTSAAEAKYNLHTDPELSVLLALNAVSIAYSEGPEQVDNTILDTLALATQTSRVRVNIADHDDSVLGLAYSQDGNYLATASADKTVKIWNAVSGTPKQSLFFADAVYAVCFSRSPDRIPDTKDLLLAAAVADGSIRLFKSDANGEQKWEPLTEPLVIPGERFYSVAMSKDGEWLAAAGETGSVRVWRLWAGQEPRPQLLPEIPNHAKSIYGLAFWQGKTPAVNRLAVASQDSTVAVWEWGQDVNSWHELFQRADGSALNGRDLGPAYSVAFSPDGGHVVAGGDKGVAIWDIGTGLSAPTFLSGLTGKVYSVAFSSDGERIAAAGEDRIIKVWEASSGQELYELSGHGGSVRAVVFSPNGKSLATASEDKTAKIWNTSFGFYKPVEGIAFNTDLNTDGTQLIAIDGAGTMILSDLSSYEELNKVFLPDTKAHYASFTQPDVNTAPRHSPRPNQEADDTSDSWPCQKRAASSQPGLNSPCTFKDIAFENLPTPTVFVATDYGVTSWKTVGATFGNVTLSYSHTGLVRMAAYNPKNSPKRWLATADDKGTIKLWKEDDASCMQRLHFQTDDMDKCQGNDSSDPQTYSTANKITALAFSQDGTLLAAGDTKGALRVWALTADPKNGTVTAELQYRFYGHDGEIRALAFDKASKRLVTASEDKLVKIWDVASRNDTPVKSNLLHTLYGHAAAVNDVVFDNAGDHLATASADGTAKIWCVPALDGTGCQEKEGRDTAWEAIRTEKSEGGGGINAVAFSPDNTRLAIAGKDRRVYIHILPPLDKQLYSGKSGFERSDLQSIEVNYIKKRIGTLALQALKQLSRTWTKEECQKYAIEEECTAETRGIQNILDGNRAAQEGRLAEAAKHYSAALEDLPMLSGFDPNEQAQLTYREANRRILGNYENYALRMNDWQPYYEKAKADFERTWCQINRNNGQDAGQEDCKKYDTTSQESPLIDWEEQLEAGKELAKHQQVRKAVDLFQKGEELFDAAITDRDPDYKASAWGKLADANNYLCWYGSMAADAPENPEKDAAATDGVLKACQHAYEVASSNKLPESTRESTRLAYEDSYGVALALAGRKDREQEYIQYLTDYMNKTDDPKQKADRRRWLANISAGKPPLTTEERKKYFPNE